MAAPGTSVIVLGTPKGIPMGCSGRLLGWRGGGGGVLAASGFCNLETVERRLLLHCVDISTETCCWHWGTTCKFIVLTTSQRYTLWFWGITVFKCVKRIPEMASSGKYACWLVPCWSLHFNKSFRLPHCTGFPSSPSVCFLNFSLPVLIVSVFMVRIICCVSLKSSLFLSFSLSSIPKRISWNRLCQCPNLRVEDWHLLSDISTSRLPYHRLGWYCSLTAQVIIWHFFISCRQITSKQTTTLSKTTHILL